MEKLNNESEMSKHIIQTRLKPLWLTFGSSTNFKMILEFKVLHKLDFL
jgi:hypothetical protein